MLKRAAKTIDTIALAYIVALLLFVLFAFSGKHALALFGSPLQSPVNTFKMKYLDFSLVPQIFDSSVTAVPGSLSEPMSLGPGGGVDKIITVVQGLPPSVGQSVPFHYDVEFIKNAGSDDFCKALDVRIQNDIIDQTTDLFTQGSSSISGTKLIDNQQTIASWIFTFSLPEDANFSNVFCKFKVKYSAFQVDTNGNSPIPGPGLTDEEEEELLIQSLQSTTLLNRFVNDTHVEEFMPDTVLGTFSGENTVLQVKSKNNDIKRSFLKFDYNFPSGVTVTSAKVKLYKNGGSGGGSRSYGIHRLIDEFGEGITNWNNAPSFDSTPTSVTSVTPTTQNTWVEFDVTSDIQSVVNNTAINHGWVIRDQSETGNHISSFVSSRNSHFTSFHPVLEITFTASAAPNNCPPAHANECVLINEVYVNVSNPTRGSPDGQWVELYNNSSTPVDVSGWNICDNDTCDRLPAGTTPIPASGFGLISKYNSYNQSSEAEDSWAAALPAGIIRIRLVNNTIGFGLSSVSEKLVLKNSIHEEIDSISWGLNTSVNNPSLPYVPQGSSLARVVKGYDNNLKSDWLVNASPNPGTNPLPSGGEEIIRIASVGSIVANVANGFDNLPLYDLSQWESDEAQTVRMKYEEELAAKASSAAIGSVIIVTTDPGTSTTDVQVQQSDSCHCEKEVMPEADLPQADNPVTNAQLDPDLPRDDKIITPQNAGTGEGPVPDSQQTAENLTPPEAE